MAESRNGHAARIERLEHAQDRIFKRLDEIQHDLAHRLPVWATILISILTLFLGWALKGG